MEPHPEKLAFIIIHPEMKRLLIALLALAFSLPTCGSVLAFSSMDMEHSDMTAPSGEISSSAPSIGTSCPHQSATSTPALDCCDSDAIHAKIGIWQSGTSEKSLKTYTRAVSYPTSVDTAYSISTPRSRYPSTAPPEDHQHYHALVGIMKITV